MALRTDASPPRTIMMPHPRAVVDRHASLPDVLQFMQVLWALVHGLESTSKRMSHQIGVSGPQRLVLRVAGLFPGLSAGDVATILHVHPSTLTGILQRLITQKLLHRAGDPRDRRRTILRLTARGARVNAVRDGTVESAIAAALADVSARDRAVAKRVLVRLAGHLTRESRTRADDGLLTARPFVSDRRRLPGRELRSKSRPIRRA